jgi:hypothetical protein
MLDDRPVRDGRVRGSIWPRWLRHARRHGLEGRLPEPGVQGQRDGETLAHLAQNPKIALVYRNRDAGKNWRFWGEATLLPDGEVREGIMGRTFQAELDRDPERKGIAVLIRVDRVSGTTSQKRGE